MSHVVSLDQALQLDVNAIGGKALHLAELSAAGFNVPPAFVITTAAFVEHFQRAGAAALLESHVPPRADQLAMLRAHDLNQDLAEQIQAAHATLAARFDGDLLCAVRSSGAEEDSENMSFAGQHSTYYYTQGSDLARRVVDCWLSCWNPQANAYRATNGQQQPRMAVIVQQMVLSDVSGVTFTRDPTEPDSLNLVIESCWGLGAALVDGRVTPDRYRLTRDGHQRVNTRIGTKRFKVAEDLIDPEGTRLEGVPRHQQRQATLSPPMIEQVAKLGADCESHFRAPQDVEWAVVRNQLFVLQSRPVTGAVVPSDVAIDGQWLVFKPIIENFTEALTPLTIDITRRVIPPIGRFIDGRFYLNFKLIRALVPLDLDDAQLADLALWRSPSETPRVNWRRVWLPALFALHGYLSWGTLLVRTRHLPARALAGFKVRCAAVLADDRLDAVDAARALFLGTGPLAPAGHLAFQVNVSSVRYFVLIDVLRSLLGRFAPDLDPNLIGPLCAGSTDMLSTQLIEDLRTVAELADAEPAVRELLMDEPPETLAATLAAEPASRTFLGALEAFLARYGHRGTREVELAAPRWQEDPTPLLGMIRNLLLTNRADHDQRAADQHHAAEQALHAALPGRLQRVVAGWLIKRIRYYATLRENTRYFHVMGLTAVRQKILELERELISDGTLKCPDDIFYLKWDEIIDLRKGTLEWRDANGLIRARRLEHLRLSERRPPETFNITLAPVTDTDAALTGQCACPGVAEGNARLILDPATDAALQPGEILVAPYTDPAWTPLFLNAAAIVVEVGSFLSHAGTVAREYGVPCVVDVEGCMERLTTGQRLRVDAGSGQIQILEPADTPA